MPQLNPFKALRVRMGRMLTSLGRRIEGRTGDTDVDTDFNYNYDDRERSELIRGYISPESIVKWDTKLGRFRHAETKQIMSKEEVRIRLEPVTRYNIDQAMKEANGEMTETQRGDIIDRVLKLYKDSPELAQEIIQQILSP